MKDTHITLSETYKEIRVLMEKTKPNRQTFYDTAVNLRNQSIAISSILRAFSDNKGFNGKCIEKEPGIIQIEYTARDEEYKYLSQSTAEQITQDLNKHSPEPLHVDQIEFVTEIHGTPNLRIIVSIV